jgi:hypothetical protein
MLNTPGKPKPFDKVVKKVVNNPFLGSPDRNVLILRLIREDL